MGSRISAYNISFSHSAAPLLSGISFQLQSGLRVALVGPNGCGKTTLLRILNGELEFDGVLRLSGSSILVKQHTDDLRRSGGEARFAELERAFKSGCELLLLDEPTNDLDECTRKRFFLALDGFDGATILVSHDPAVLDAVDEIWELQKGKLVKHPPGFENFLSRMDAEESALQARIANMTSELKTRKRLAKVVIARQEKRATRGEKQGKKANLPAVIQGAKKRQAENTLARIKSIQIDRTEEEQTELRKAKERLRDVSSFKWNNDSSRPHADKRVCEVKHFTLKGKADPLNLLVTGARRIRLHGANGSGKSTLLKALSGDLDARLRCNGEFYLGGPHCLFDQRLTQFGGSEILWRWFQPRLQKDIAATRLMLGSLGFAQTEQEKPVSQLSGGEKMRLELALCVKEAPQLLLLDEPTNHLDLDSRRILSDFLRNFQGAMIVVSHDSHFVQSLELDETVSL